MPSTALLALPYPASTSPDDVPGDMAALANAVEVIFADQGTRLARPATPLRGRRYWATDEKQEYRADGTAWDTPGVSKAGGSTILASAAGVVPLTLKLASGQTASGLEVRSNADVLLAKIDAAGGATVGALASGAHTVTSPSAGTVGLTVVLAASSTANAIEVRSSAAALLASISGAGNASLGTLTATTSTLGATTATSPAAGTVGFTVKLAASATASALEIRSSTNAVLTIFDKTGTLKVGSASRLYSDSDQTGGLVPYATWLSTAATNVKPVVIQAMAGQTAPTLEIQSSTTAALVDIYPDGTTAIGPLPGSGAGYLSVTSPTAGARSLVLRGAPGQTANGLEVQSNTGVPLLSVSSAGAMNVGVNGGAGLAIGSAAGGLPAKPVLLLTNTSGIASSPAGGGQVYCEGGALKYRGELGTVTVLGNA